VISIGRIVMGLAARLVVFFWLIGLSKPLRKRWKKGEALYNCNQEQCHN